MNTLSNTNMNTSSITEELTQKSISKPFRKLGFTTLETAEIVIALKKLMANYQVHYFKLRNFHWNVEGSDFFELHAEFENEYNEAKKRIDMIAERIRVFGIKPSISIEELNDMSRIQEHTEIYSSYEMVKEVLNDYQILHELMLDVINASLETGDIGTENLVADFILNLEKRHWMFTSWIK